MCISSLNDLLDKPFKCFTKEEQLEIVRRGRFTDLEELPHSEKNKRRTFWVTWYQKVKWLSGNTANKKLYCWYCVLFPSGTSKAWNKIGFDDLRNLSQATKKHEESREHVYASIKLRLLKKKNEPKANDTDDPEKTIEVKKNREYLERLIDVASMLTRTEVPFRELEGEEGPYRGMVQLLKKYDDIVRNQLERDKNFHGLTSTIQISIVQSMEQVILQKITEEVSAAKFFSLIVEEMNSDAQAKRISVAIRYLKKEVPVERFVGLFEVNHGAKAQEVAAILTKALDKFNYKEKMVSQSYDGKVVKATELYSLQQTMKNHQHPHCQSQLVHYYAHDFRQLLVQSLNSVQECKLFFSVIWVFCQFFQDLNFQDEKEWFKSVPSCITNLKNQYDHIWRLLEYVTVDEQYENDPYRISNAVNLLNHLKNFKFMVFVTMFEKYFQYIEHYIEKAKRKILNTEVCRATIRQLITELRTYKESSLAFTRLVEPVASIGVCNPSIVAKMFEVNVKVVDSLIHEIEGRFLDIELGDFFALVDVDNFSSNDEQKKAPDSALLLSLKESYPKFFDSLRLKSELNLLYNDPSIGGFEDVDIKQIKDMLKFIHDNDIKEDVPELYKLLELVVTVPTFATPLEGRQCVLNRINSYRKSDKSEEPRSGLALLVIEKDLLMEISKGEEWYSEVIDYFAQLPATSSIELIQRKNTREASSTEHEMKTEIAEAELEIKTEPDMF